MTNKKPGTFKKGDPRINRRGRPKSFDALRALAQQIANETAVTKEGTPAIHDDGINPPHVMTNVEAVLRRWMGGNSQQQRAAIEIAFGKVPENIDVTSNGSSLVTAVVKVYIPDNGRDRNPTAT